MKTGLERIAAKARKETKLKFTTIAHHVTRELIWESLCHIRKKTAPGIDMQTVKEAKDSFERWVECMLTSLYRSSYKAPVIRRVYIPLSLVKQRNVL